MKIKLTERIHGRYVRHILVGCEHWLSLKDSAVQMTKELNTAKEECAEAHKTKTAAIAAMKVAQQQACIDLHTAEVFRATTYICLVN